MATWFATFLVIAACQFEAEQDGVRIRAEVASNLYTWTVTNVSAEPITSFAIDVHHTYDFQGPEDWELDGPMPSGAFRAWTTDELRAIRPYKSATFSVRVNSRGAILGEGVATIGLSNGIEVVIPGVWQPVPESRTTIAIVAAGACVLATLHVLGGVVRTRRERSRVNASAGLPESAKSH
ncbi:MAG: hypothetical protein H6817_05705 [Phycisphaerales bacterium]|nr:hypothetical protein [Phycisphaerales bacterium]